MENTRTRRAGFPSLVKGKAPRHRCGHSPTPVLPQGPLGLQADVSLCPPRVGTRLRLEVLVKRRGRGAFVQPLDVAGVTEQAVLQRVAAVAVLVIQLQTTVLGEARMPGGDTTEQKDCETDAGCWCTAPRTPQGRSGRHGLTPGPLATCRYRALETGLPRNEPGCQCEHTPDPRLRT